MTRLVAVIAVVAAVAFVVGVWLMLAFGVRAITELAAAVGALAFILWAWRKAAEEEQQYIEQAENHEQLRARLRREVWIQ